MLVQGKKDANIVKIFLNTNRSWLTVSTQITPVSICLPDCNATEIFVTNRKTDRKIERQTDTQG